MNKIAVFDYRLHPDVQAQIQSLASNKVEFPAKRCPEEEWISRTGDADIALVTTWDKIDPAYLDACPKLRYIGLCGTSTANIDLEELAKRRIAFSNIVSKDKESVAEYFFMQLVSLARGEGEYQ
jgi:phosphoglycerate dehydrogenase-like enzyme